MQDKAIAAASYLIAAAIMGIWIYFLPMMFFGFILGVAIGSNIEKIKNWLDNS